MAMEVVASVMVVEEESRGLGVGRGLNGGGRAGDIWSARRHGAAAPLPSPRASRCHPISTSYAWDGGAAEEERAAQVRPPP